MPSSPSPLRGEGRGEGSPASRATTPPSRAHRLAVTLLAALLWPVVLFQYLFVLRGYDKLFRAYNLKVDDLSGRVLNLSAWLRARSFVAFAITFLLMAVTVGAVYAVQTAPLSGRRRAAVLFLIFAVPCLVFLVTLLTVENTKRTLFEGLRKQ
jgi:hypothetical protein